MILICIFSYTCLYCCCASVSSNAARRVAVWATSTLMKFLANCSGHIAEKGSMWSCKNQSWGMKCWKRSLKRQEHWLSPELHPSIQSSLPAPWCWNVVPPPFPQWEPFSKRSFERIRCYWFCVDGISDWTPGKPMSFKDSDRQMGRSTLALVTPNKPLCKFPWLFKPPPTNL